MRALPALTTNKEEELMCRLNVSYLVHTERYPSQKILLTVFGVHLLDAEVVNRVGEVYMVHKDWGYFLLFVCAAVA